MNAKYTSQDKNTQVNKFIGFSVYMMEPTGRGTTINNPLYIGMAGIAKYNESRGIVVDIKLPNVDPYFGFLIHRNSWTHLILCDYNNVWGAPLNQTYITSTAQILTISDRHVLQYTIEEITLG